MSSPSQGYPTRLESLRSRLRSPLPGFTAQRPMSPEPVAGPPFPYGSAGGRPAAVLALLVPDPPVASRIPPRLRLVLTRRTDRVSHHKGQICMPGGIVQPGETAREAALRETEEEIGLDAARVEVLGELSPLFVPVSGFRIRPFVGVVPLAPDLRPDPREVAEILPIPVDELFAAASCGERVETRAEMEVRIPYFQWQGHEIWGATAMMLSELRALLLEC